MRKKLAIALLILLRWIDSLSFLVGFNALSPEHLWLTTSIIGDLI